MTSRGSINAGLTGERVALRTLSVDNVSYLRWMNDPDLLRHLESRFESHTIEPLRQFVAAVRADPDSVRFGIMLCAGDRHTGSIKLGTVARAHGTADIGLLCPPRTLTQ